MLVYHIKTKITTWEYIGIKTKNAGLCIFSVKTPLTLTRMREARQVAWREERGDDNGCRGQRISVSLFQSSADRLIELEGAADCRDIMNRMAGSERIFWTSPELVDMLIPFLDVEACLLYVLVFFYIRIS